MHERERECICVREHYGYLMYLNLGITMNKALTAAYELQQRNTVAACLPDIPCGRQVRMFGI